MDIAQFATAQQKAVLLRNVDVRVLSKMLDDQRAQGRGAIELIEASAVTPKKGAPEPGKGGKVDYVA